MTQPDPHWSEFYASDSATVEPSPFAVFIDARYPGHRSVVEFGSGNGRDAVYFAQQGRQVQGFDLCSTAITKGRQLAASRNVSGAVHFAEADILDSRSISDVIDRRATDHAPTLYYARFFLHSVDEVREDRFIELVRSSMVPGDLLCLEFRTNKDALNYKIYDDHYRRFIDPERLREKFARSGLSVEYLLQGTDLAIYRNENPHVARMIVAKDPHA